MLKKLSILAIALFLFGGSTFAFAWWDDLETTDSDIEIGVGQGVTLEIDALDEAEDNLVPASAVEQEGQTDEITLTYTVSLDTDVDEALNLTTEIGDKSFNDDALNDDVINIDINQDEDTIENESVDITLTVTLSDDEDDYTEDVSDYFEANISFNATFTASQPD